MVDKRFSQDAVLRQCISEVKSLYADKMYIGEPLYVTRVYEILNRVDGVVDVRKVKTIVCSLRNSTVALLRGVVTLGSCYTPGEYVRVTVGIKPETIAQARKMSGQINRSPGSGASNGYVKPQPSGSLNNMGGYSDDQRLYDF